MNASIRRIAAASSLIAAPALIALGVAAGAHADTGAESHSVTNQGPSISQPHLHHHHAQLHAGRN